MYVVMECMFVVMVCMYVCCDGMYCVVMVSAIILSAFSCTLHMLVPKALLC